MSEQLLRYHSGVQDALEPGECVLWEGRPEPERITFGLRNFGLLDLGSILGVGLAPVLGFTLGLKPAVITGGIGAACVLANVASRMHTSSQLNARRYRVTDRRIMAVHPQPSLSRSIEADDVRTVIVTRAGNFSSIMVGGWSVARFERLADPAPPIAQILAHPLCSDRARRMRRRLPESLIHAENPKMSQPPPEPETEIDLQPGEQLLWSGRPRDRDLRDTIWWQTELRRAAWLLMPIGWIGVAAYFLRDFPSNGFLWFIGGVGVVWIGSWLHSILIAPFKKAKIRRRTRYALTNLRAVTVLIGPSRTTTVSRFLDMMSLASVEIKPDGSGSISVGRREIVFDNIEHAAEVHRILIDLVRGIGGPRPVTTASED